MVVGNSWRSAVVIGIAFFLAIAITFAFAYRAGRSARRIHMENEPIRAWMSVPFIAHTHHVPASELFAAIGIQPREPHDRRSIRRLAHDTGRPVPELIGEIERALNAAQHKPGGPQ
jgi:hypothetical protein